jgi:ribulose-phosphate 3-epimerase
MKPNIISASILSADFTRLGDEIKTVEEAGADWIHVDVMDGHFVPNITMGPFVLENIKRVTSMPLDVHLMIENPDKFVEIFANAGANSISVHLEGNSNIHRTLQVLNNLNVKTGLVINPGTPVEASSELLHMLDYVLLMSVNPGFSGQIFQPQTFERVRKLRKMLDEINPEAGIEIDGGVSSENIQKLQLAGANIFIAATSIFKHPKGARAGVQELREALR